jgi:hypothetical protein
VAVHGQVKWSSADQQEDGCHCQTHHRQDEAPRFELEAQFISLSIDPPSTICRFCATITDERIHTEPGFGGRFTFGVTEIIVVEAEGHSYIRDLFNLPDPAKA